MSRYTRTNNFPAGQKARGAEVKAELDAVQQWSADMPDSDEVWSGNVNYAAAGGTANAITFVAPNTWTSYTGKDGYKLSIRIAADNTGAATLNVDGLGAKAVVRNDGTALQAADLKQHGIYEFSYNESQEKFYVTAFNGIAIAAAASAAAAAASAAAALSSQNAASSSASSASSSASSASTSASTATTQAGIATTQAGIATTQAGIATAAAASITGSTTGTGAYVRADSPTLVTPALGTPSAIVLTNASGTASININGTVGATTPAAGAFTTLSASGAVTLSGGTANGIAYLNGSKVVTSGSALAFDGTNFTQSLSSSGGSVLHTLSNTSNTASSSAAYEVKVGGGSAGDPWIHYRIEGLQSWYTGIDNSDSDAFVIGNSGAVGGSNVLKLTTAGNVGLTGNGTGNRFIALLNETDTYAGTLILQAGGGSASYGGGLVMYGDAHASFPGWVKAGISSGSGGKFSVNSGGTGTGTDVFTVSSAGATDIVYGGISLLIGADNAASTRTNNTAKYARIAAPHYQNAEESVCIAVGASDASNNSVLIGGGSGSLNAANIVAIYTGATTTTLTGTLRVLVDSAKIQMGLNTVIGSTSVSPDGTLHVHTATAGSVTAASLADDLVVENSGDGGLTVLTPNASTGYMVFGSVSDNFGAGMSYNYDGNLTRVFSAKVGMSLQLAADNSVNNLILSGASGSELATFAGALTATASRADGNSIAVFSNTGTGRALQVNRAVASATRPVATIAQTNVSGGTQAALAVQQADTGEIAIGVNEDGSLTAFNWLVRSDGVTIQKLPASAPTLTVNSTMTFELTSNTSLAFVVKGSDGTVRSGSIALS